MNFLFTTARVTAHNPPFGIQVVFQTTGQNPSFPVTMLRPTAGAYQVHQLPLPQIGSWVVVFFPRGDLRNGICLGAYYPSQLDALTTTQASGASATDPFNEYHASYSGDWWMLDGTGNFSRQFADGSFFVAGSDAALPTVYRHTVDGSQTQQIVALPFSDRVPSPPAAYKFHFETVSGTKFDVDSSGNVAVSGAPGATLTFAFDNISITFGGSGATVTLPGSETFNISQGGGAASDFLVLVSKFITKFNAHTHSGGGSGPPSTLLVPADVEAVAVKISG